jgi:hypothetical protein
MRRPRSQTFLFLALQALTGPTSHHIALYFSALTHPLQHLDLTSKCLRKPILKEPTPNTHLLIRAHRPKGIPLKQTNRPTAPLEVPVGRPAESEVDAAGVGVAVGQLDAPVGVFAGVNAAGPGPVASDEAGAAAKGDGGGERGRGEEGEGGGDGEGG